MFHGHVSVAEARALFLVMVVSVESGLYVGPGPSPLLQTYPESGSRELVGSGLCMAVDAQLLLARVAVLIRWSAEQQRRKIIREI